MVVDDISDGDSGVWGGGNDSDRVRVVNAMTHIAMTHILDQVR